MEGNCKALYLTSKRIEIICLSFAIMEKYVMPVLTDRYEKTDSQKF